MVYCLNPNCRQPQNKDTNNVCDSCGSNLLIHNRFRAIKVIGQGGFGKTYLALNKSEPSSQLCVIKQFSFPNSSTALRLFAEEAQRLNTLGSHPQIPTFIDYVEQDNQYFIVQEYIDGNNLEEELAVNGAFNETKIEQLLINILPVIKFVHEGGVIHRDIKPENIIRRKRDRQLVLVDFGAAKRATETSLAKTGTTIGSAGYAAPEQTFGKAATQSDLYSLGVTCVHLMTGMHPFDLMDSAEGNWVWRDYLKQPVSQKLGQILDKLLERGTRQRYQSAAEVLNDLQGTEAAYAIAARDLIREVAELYKQAPVEELPVRRFHPGKIAAIGLLASVTLAAIPIAINVLNHSPIATVPQEQVRKVPAPKPIPAPQRREPQPQQSQEDIAATASLPLVISIFKVVAFVAFLSSILGALRSYNRGEDVQSVVTPVIVAFMFVVIANVTPTLFGLDVASDPAVSSTSTSDLLNQILLERQRR